MPDTKTLMWNAESYELPARPPLRAILLCDQIRREGRSVTPAEAHRLLTDFIAPPVLDAICTDHDLEVSDLGPLLVAAMDLYADTPPPSPRRGRLARLIRRRRHSEAA
ncbi:MAG: hypothetical protein M0R73_12445 [Dehalococcoidia bacterium]|nr:hypothetical protein [Dehalococcoidia bacterium]